MHVRDTHVSVDNANGNNDNDDVYINVHINVHIDTHINVHIDTHVDIHIDIYIDTVHHVVFNSASVIDSHSIDIRSAANIDLNINIDIAQFDVNLTKRIDRVIDACDNGAEHNAAGGQFEHVYGLECNRSNCDSSD